MTVPAWERAKDRDRGRRPRTCCCVDRRGRGAHTQSADLFDRVDHVVALVHRSRARRGRSRARAARHRADDFINDRRQGSWDELPASARAKVIARAMVANGGGVRGRRGRRQGRAVVPVRQRRPAHRRGSLRRRWWPVPDAARARRPHVRSCRSCPCTPRTARSTTRSSGSKRAAHRRRSSSRRPGPANGASTTSTRTSPPSPTRRTNGSVCDLPALEVGVAAFHEGAYALGGICGGVDQLLRVALLFERRLPARLARTVEQPLGHRDRLARSGSEAAGPLVGDLGDLVLQAPRGWRCRTAGLRRPGDRRRRT